MNRILAGGIGLLTAFAVVAPALADEPPPTRKRVRAAPARVAPPPRPAPEPEPVRQASNWSGGQVGGSNGGSFSNNAFAEPGSYICPPNTALGSSCFETPFSFDKNEASYTIGAFLGYNMQFGAIVIGVEGDIAWKNAESSVQQVTDTQINYASNYYLRNDNFTGTMEQGWDGSLRGRIGLLVTPWTLLYGTGGLAFGEVSGSLAYVGILNQCLGGAGVNCTSFIGKARSSTSFSETRTGYTVGGGVEIQMFGPWTGRLEYRYTDLGEFTKAFPVSTNCPVSPTCGSPSPGATIDLHPTFHTVRVGLGIPLGNLFGFAGL